MSEDTIRPWGEWLQARREELGISLEQAEADTHIRLRYLQALEASDIASLPDPFVGRGFLRNYAAYLELDLAEATGRYPEIFSLPASEPIEVDETSPFVTQPFRPVALHRIGGGNRRRWLLIGAIVIVVVALGLLAWWFYPELSDLLTRGEAAALPTTNEPTRQSTDATLSTATHTPTTTRAATSMPATTSVPATTVTVLPTLTPSVTLSPSPSPTPSPSVYTGVFLELLFTNTSWIQVTVDGVRQFQGELEEGTYRSWYGEERIELRIGNAGAVQVTINGQSLGTLGEPGEVIDRVFEKAGEEITEATITPVATGEQTAEPTVAPTAEATLTPTPAATVAPLDVTLSPTAVSTPTLTLTPTVTITATASP